MRAVLTVFATFALMVPAISGDRYAEIWTAKARSIIIAHHLLSRSELRCTGLVYGVESTPTTAGITAVEKHGGKCKGDPDTAPRIFSMQINKATGQAKWDRDTGDFVMKPIP